MMIKKFLTALALVALSQQALAVSVTGINFLDVANSLDASTSGTFLTNYTTPGKTEQYSGVDGNAASYTYGAVLDQTSILGVSFGSAADVANVNLTLLLVGTDPHTGTVSLFGGTGGASGAIPFSITPYDAGTGTFTGYTGYNSVTTVPPTAESGTASTTTLGIFELTINLADTFGSGFGTFSGVQLQITGADGNGGFYDAAPSLIGTTAVVPVPAAVWLFGSGLLGLVGVVRRRK